MSRKDRSGASIVPGSNFGAAWIHVLASDLIEPSSRRRTNPPAESAVTIGRVRAGSCVVPDSASSPIPPSNRPRRQIRVMGRVRHHIVPCLDASGQGHRAIGPSGHRPSGHRAIGHRAIGPSEGIAHNRHMIRSTSVAIALALAVFAPMGAAPQGPAGVVDTIVNFTATDGTPLQAKLSVPAGAAGPVGVVFNLHGAGPRNFDHRVRYRDKDGEIKAVNYYDYYARELAARGLAFF